MSRTTVKECSKNSKLSEQRFNDFRNNLLSFKQYFPTLNDFKFPIKYDVY